jgi:CheY-like chemotaxis protein
MTSSRRKTGPNRTAPQRTAPQRTAPQRTAPQRPLEILLIEGTPTEARRTLRALRQGPIRSRITVVDDGEQALALLRSQPGFRPDIILLDWYLPRKGGRAVLDDLKSDPAFRHGPVIVLSISDRQEDVVAAYDGHANSFVTKPADPKQFAAALKLVEVFWSSRLPAQSEASAWFSGSARAIPNEATSQKNQPRAKRRLPTLCPVYRQVIDRASGRGCGITTRGERQSAEDTYKDKGAYRGYYKCGRTH